MFYKYQDECLLDGKVVTTPNFELTAETKANFVFPIDDWYWFDSEEEAQVFFNIVQA